MAGDPVRRYNNIQHGLNGSSHYDNLRTPLSTIPVVNNGVDNSNLGNSNLNLSYGLLDPTLFEDVHQQRCLPWADYDPADDQHRPNFPLGVPNGDTTQHDLAPTPQDTFASRQSYNFDDNLNNIDVPTPQDIAPDLAFPLDPFLQLRNPDADRFSYVEGTQVSVVKFNENDLGDIAEGIRRKLDTEQNDKNAIVNNRLHYLHDAIVQTSPSEGRATASIEAQSTTPASASSAVKPKRGRKRKNEVRENFTPTPGPNNKKAKTQDDYDAYGIHKNCNIDFDGINAKREICFMSPTALLVGCSRERLPPELGSVVTPRVAKVKYPPLLNKDGRNVIGVQGRYLRDIPDWPLILSAEPENLWAAEALAAMTPGAETSDVTDRMPSTKSFSGKNTQRLGNLRKTCRESLGRLAVDPTAQMAAPETAVVVVSQLGYDQLQRNACWPLSRDKRYMRQNEGGPWVVVPCPKADFMDRNHADSKRVKDAYDMSTRIKNHLVFWGKAVTLPHIRFLVPTVYRGTEPGKPKHKSADCHDPGCLPLPLNDEEKKKLAKVLVKWNDKVQKAAAAAASPSSTYLTSSTSGQDGDGTPSDDESLQQPHH